MIDLYFLKIVLAGFVYIVTPGPVFLSIISLVSEQGRIQGLKLISGAIIGCMIWLSFTVASMIESDRLPEVLFSIIATLSSSYLFWLGFRMFKNANKRAKNRVFEKPFLDGFALGFLNPKSYPVMLSVFSALLLQRYQPIEWSAFPSFFVFAVIGFLLGYLFMVTTAGVKTFSSFYIKNIHIFSYAFGVLYIGFGAHLLLNTFYGTSS